MKPGRRSTAALCAVVLAALVAGASAAVAGQNRGPLVVTDSLGRRVEVPERVLRIISLEPEITRIIVALGGGERLVGVDFFLRHYDPLFGRLLPESGGLPVFSNQAQDLNYERALALRPDFVFTSPSELQSTEGVESKLRTPVAALASIGRFDNLLREMATIGQIIGREERAEELSGYFKARLAAVARALGTAPAGEKPRVYLSFWGTLLRTPVTYDPVDAAGGTNCARGLLPSYLGTAGATVPVEQIVRWNPDIILIQGNYPPRQRAVTVQNVLADSRLAAVRAVRTGRVHYTFGFWYWWDPALVLVETLYLANLFHPSLFPAFDLEKEGNEIYKVFYGVDGAFSALSRVLNCHEWLHK
jgi:iron complex transport system substrate-binding protein